MITKKAKKQYLKQKLATNSGWALKALTSIYDRQTADEKLTGDTKHDNHIGFSGAHAEFMSSLAKQYNQRHSLSPKQMAFVFKVMPKYWKQIQSITNEDKLLQCMLKDNVITAADFMVAKL